ncbi:hypothetical protein T08_8772 [Trichinella sp. T8]|nr:hypothetical protein T08_8772 [Trichinella sp. T8]
MDALCQRDLGITETTAPVSKSKETIVPFSLPFTHGMLPACSLAMINTLRFRSPPLCVPVGCRWFRRLSWGQSRQRWPKPPQLKQPSAPALPASGNACSPRVSTDGLGGFSFLWLWTLSPVCDCCLW